MTKPALIAAALLAAFACGLFFTGYRDTIYAPAIFLLLLTGCGTVIPSFWKGCNIPGGAVSFFLFALWLYITLSLSWSTVPFASLVTWLVFICLPLTFFSLSAPQDARRYITAAALSLLAALAALGAWAFVQTLFFSGVYGARAHHPLPNANDLAALLNLGLFPTIAFILHKKEKDKIYFTAAAAAALMFAGLLATQSRSGFLFMMISAVALLAILRPPLKMAALTLGTGGSLFIMMQLLNGGRFAARLVKMATPAADTEVLSRLSLLKSVARMIADHPWGGTGLGTFYLYYPPYRAPLLDNSAGFWAHMDPLQFGAETGIAATILIYALAASVVAQTFVALRRMKKESPERAALAGFSCALLTLFLHAHTGFPLYIMPVLIVAGVWLAAWQNLAGRYAPLETAPWQRLPLALCAAAVAAMTGSMAVSSAAGQYYLLKASNNIQHARITEFLDDIERAERFAPRSFIDPDVQLAGLYIDTIGGAGILFPAEEKETMRAESLNLLDRAERMNPAWAEIDYKRGKLYAAIKENDNAVSSWRRALAKNPQHTRARAELAKAAVAAGRPADAYDLLAAGLQYPVTTGTAREYRAMMKNIAPASSLQKSFMEKEGNAP